MIATAAVARLEKKLAERIALVRGTRSQRQFARDPGAVFQQNVNRYENGSIPPQLPHHTGYDSGHFPGLAAARKGPDGVGQLNWSREFGREKGEIAMPGAETGGHCFRAWRLME
jgi:hypothetical protein